MTLVCEGAIGYMAATVMVLGLLLFAAYALRLYR